MTEDKRHSIKDGDIVKHFKRDIAMNNPRQRKTYIHIKSYVQTQ